MPYTFPTIYKKTSTGVIQQWTISVEGDRIITEYGQVDGKIQRTEDLIKAGKNLGKVNETTVEQQALSEAKSKWEKQTKKGYVENVTRAKAGESDVEGGYNPMLAHKFSEQAHKIKYPAYIQPKLDGHRCVAVIENGVCTLWSRTRKSITSVPHIVKELQELYSSGNHMIDGELYNHAYKSNFEEITSLIRQEAPAANHTEVEYHVYDKCTADVFAKRINDLANEVGVYKHVQVVQTMVVANEDDLIDAFDAFLKLGYEGAMVRNAGGLYIGKRSYDLQKIKEFDDAEFPIIGYEEGRGHLMGHVAKFVCKMPNGTEFRAKLKGDTDRLRKFFLDHSLWKGRILTVKYQGLTGRNGVPRFPVGERFREDV